MAKNKLYIDNIYWERVQLFIEGHAEGINIKEGDFLLRNLTETKELKANNVEISDNNFTCRFNVAILDNGYYLPSGEYLLVNKQELDYIATINNDVVKDFYNNLDEIELEKYADLETTTQKTNFLLKDFTKHFRRGGNSKKTVFTLAPQISSEVNEFVFKVAVKLPPKKENKLAQKYRETKKKYKKVAFNIRNATFKTIFYTTRFLHMRKGNTVLFTSDSRSEMSGNFKFVYDEMLRRNLDDKYKIHSLFKPNISERRNFTDKFKFPYLLGKADYIFVDDFHPMLYKVNFRRSQEIIQVWHAVGAFKTVGFSRTGKKGGPFFDSYNHRNYTKAYVSSETDIPFYAEAFGIKERNIIPTGVPRTDIFFDKSFKKETIEKMENLLPEIKGKNVILFAPTFRGSGHHTAHYPFFKIDFERLAKYCENNNTVVLFKMHPFVRNRLHIKNEYRKYFIDISDLREVNEVLFITDILISDYSSLIYEFAIFKRPMLFYAFDLEDYITTRDFYENYESFVPGKIVESFDDLINSLYKKDYDQHKVEPFLNKHFKYQDGRSSERVVRNLFGS
ncbi:teichoic acid ribitol-phosphate polymerase TarL [Staphylococcus epidermidis]|uniref:teichoic acid ribitol-phosphate polymerase TarL n=1 Tax=Staphylococcus epidermidis TaxID=1282 RepID=UPI00024E1596|nr:teichoic acid ribitol-phosphate polymerase TarL [Staphylococcus epidermidis]MDU6254983.1 teichoic acid ribitol-phosphate polymerase TarL [Staphylococcus warneri]EHR88112.1 CDP-glycerol:poly(glycerophosphate) glycerophosphotransferase [Staphylococcus epidermidis VCU117]KAB2225555.1 CDP-glycerol glycerophosphotransferase family protein [Staphylococcus epidermidis]KAB2297116.1 CDP-glycerol glycerophosphotransferase family protein [Staphylococcus epidermidis]KAB2303203.1 CDP-glycerol glyceropho